MQVTVMITTHNRRTDLRRTLERVLSLKPCPHEVIVTTDGCSDGTVEMLQAEFPQCSLQINPICRGSIYSRANMLKLATGDLILSLDDDSYPVEPEFLIKLAEAFDRHPEAAVITFFEQLNDDFSSSRHSSSRKGGHYVSAYANGAAAMRRKDYFLTKGFPSFFFHAYEEPDYALQVYQIGKAVWFEPSLVVRHHYSPINRDEFRTHHLNARNELWSVWMRCPWPWLPIVSLFRMSRQFCHSCKMGLFWVFQEPKWWLNAVSGLKDCIANRCSIPWPVYLAWMRLARQPISSSKELSMRFHMSPATQDIEIAETNNPKATKNN